MENLKKYTPQKNSWAAKTINYLKKHKSATSVQIKQGIGIVKAYPNSKFSDHGDYLFDTLVIYRLTKRGVVIRIKRGVFKLA